jgi:hypothetical protein
MQKQQSGAEELADMIAAAIDCLPSDGGASFGFT